MRYYTSTAHGRAHSVRDLDDPGRDLVLTTNRDLAEQAERLLTVYTDPANLPGVDLDEFHPMVRAAVHAALGRSRSPMLLRFGDDSMVGIPPAIRSRFAALEMLDAANGSGRLRSVRYHVTM